MPKLAKKVADRDEKSTRKKDGRPDYRVKAGDTVPSVTTVIGKCDGWNKNVLMGWANKVGREQGVHHSKFVDSAGRAGTYSHALVESFLKGEEPPDKQGYTQEEITLGEQGFANFKDWLTHFDFELVASEHILVSEKLKTGGTLDIVARLSGDLCLLDFKTSNFVGQEQVVQVSTYKVIWDENYPRDRIKKAFIIKVGKDDASFSWHQLGPKVMAASVKAFKHWRALYDLEKEIKI